MQKDYEEEEFNAQMREFMKQADIIVNHNGKDPFSEMERKAADVEMARLAEERRQKEEDDMPTAVKGHWLFEDVPYEAFDRFVRPLRAGVPAWWEMTECDGGGPTYRNYDDDPPGTTYGESIFEQRAGGVPVG